jgi:hypothetical protein
MDCNAADARAVAIASSLDRRKSRDSRTRVKLDLALTEAFIDALVRRRIEREMESCAGDLRAIRERLAARSVEISTLRIASAV